MPKKLKTRKEANRALGIDRKLVELIESMALAEDRKINTVAERLIRKGLELEGVAHR